MYGTKKIFFALAVERGGMKAVYTSKSLYGLFISSFGFSL